MNKSLATGIFLIILIFAALYFLSSQIPERLRTEAPEGYAEVAVKDVRISEGGGLVLLGENASNEVLPIYISAEQARDIARALHKIPSERPLAHDLLASILDSAGMRLSYVSIDRLEGGTYYATIVARNGETKKIDARPSDSIILALKSGIPIYVHRQLMQEKSAPPERMEIQSFKYENV